MGENKKIPQQQRGFEPQLRQRHHPLHASKMQGRTGNMMQILPFILINAFLKQKLASST